MFVLLKNVLKDGARKSQDQLVCFNLFSTFTYQGDIRKLIVISMSPKSRKHISFEIIPLKAQFFRHFSSNRVTDTVFYFLYSVQKGRINQVQIQENHIGCFKKKLQPRIHIFTFLEASGSGNQGKVSLSKITAKMQYNHPNFYHNHYHLQNHNCQQNHYPHNIHPPPNLYHHQAKVKSKSKSKSKQDHSKKAAFCWEPASGKFGTDPQIIFIFFNCPVFSVFAVCLFVI